MGLRINIHMNITMTDFLAVTLDLSSGNYKPYHKPNERLTYINTDSCHPPTVFKSLVKDISKDIKTGKAPGSSGIC